VGHSQRRPHLPEQWMSATRTTSCRGGSATCTCIGCRETGSRGSGVPCSCYGGQAHAQHGRTGGFRRGHAPAATQRTRMNERVSSRRGCDDDGAEATPARPWSPLRDDATDAVMVDELPRGFFRSVAQRAIPEQPSFLPRGT
jgi:hypothetical protein